MAFSMFLRSSACANRTFAQQFMRFTTQSLTQQSVAKTLPVTTIPLKDVNRTPLLSAVRPFRTSVVSRSELLPHNEHPHDHAKLWVIEKVTSALLVPLIPLSLLVPDKLLDCIVSVLICAHTFWGLEAIAVDYVRESIFGTIIPKIAIGLVYALTIATLGGLFYIISHDIGIANTVRAIWAIKPEQKA